MIFFIPPIISGIFIDEIKMSLPKDEIKNGNINDAVPLIAIERHRLLTDGEGITTLVGFQGCPLRCKYCIINIETSLNFSIESLQKLLPIIDCWIVDIKDLDETIYKVYTECSNEQVLSNLRYISEHGYTDKVQIRLPLIPAYNTNGDREISENRLREMGFANFDKFAYKEVKATSLSNANHHDINYGKAVCEVLKQARIGLAKEFSIKYEPHHCNHLQCKTGSCHVCEKELSWLESQIEKF